VAPNPYFWTPIHQVVTAVLLSTLYTLAILLECTFTARLTFTDSSGELLCHAGLCAGTVDVSLDIWSSGIITPPSLRPVGAKAFGWAERAKMAQKFGN